MKPKQIIYGGLLAATAIILPQLFHFIGAQAGKILLPMYLPVLAAGILLGPMVGLCVAIIAPLCSHMLTGMPAIPFLYFMMIELMAYAIISGLLRKRCSVYITVLITFLGAKCIGGACMLLCVWLFGFSAPFATPIAVGAAIVTALPGFALQAVVMPLILLAAKQVRRNAV